MTPHFKLSFPRRRLALFGLAFGATLAGANAAPVALTPPGISSHIMQISKMSGGDLCIVGGAMDPDGDLQTRGRVIVFSPARNKILWQQTVDAPDDNAALRMVACRADGKFIYVGGNVDTHSERSLNQTLAYVYKFDSAGKLAAVKELVTGARNAYIYDIDTDEGGLTVAGMMRDDKTPAKANGMYFARLDANFKTSSLVKSSTGAYQIGAAVKLSRNVAVFGGNFLPADANIAPVEDYAVSKIVAGKYQFSVRALKAKPKQIATAIAATDDIVSLDYTGNGSSLTAIGADGKASAPLPVKSALCQVDSMAADADAVYAVRRSCARPDDAARLVTINRKTGVETLKGGVAGEPQFVISLESKLYVVSAKADKTLLIQALATDLPDVATDPINLAQMVGGVKRELTLSKWSVDKRGVPSFDYRYSQSGPKCDYERSGRAVAGFEDNKGHIELQVYSGQDDKGKESATFTIFYDHDDEVVFSMPTSGKFNPAWVTFEDAAMKKKFPARCGFTAKESAAMFKK